MDGDVWRFAWRMKVVNGLQLARQVGRVSTFSSLEISARRALIITLSG